MFTFGINKENRILEQGLIIISFFYYFFMSVFTRLPFSRWMIAAVLAVEIFYVIYKNPSFSLTFTVSYVILNLLAVVNVFVYGSDLLYEYLPQYLLAILPMMLAGYLIDFEKYDTFIYYVSVVYEIALFAYVVLIYTRANQISVQNINYMGFAYNVLPAFLVIISRFFRKQTLHGLAFVLVGVVYLIMCGTRGPLICAAVFFLLSAAVNFRTLDRRTVAAGTFLIAAGVVVLFNIQRIAQMLFPVFIRLHLSTRILNYFIYINESTSLTGRNVLYEQIMENIDAHPVIGSGLMSDRIVLDGVYTHNLFLEIINAFGLPLGVFLIIALGFLLIRGFLGTRSIAYKNYICIFFAASVIRLLFSYSFMEDIHFYMMLGVCFSAFEKHGIHSRERDT